jgi:hypothetical protein
MHDIDEGPVGRSTEGGLCLVCGAAIDLAGLDDIVGKRLAGGEANPAALARPTSSRPRRTGGSRSGSGARSTGGRKTAGTRTGGTRRAG